jgi:hypothetical protein
MIILILIVIIILIFFIYLNRLESFDSGLNMSKYNSKSFVKRKDYLVFSSVGKQSCYKMWVGSDKNYDLAFYLFEDNPNFNPKGVDYIWYRKGFKFPNFYDFYKKYRDIILSYKAIWIADDDLEISSMNINHMFEVFSKYNLKLGQPAYSKQSNYFWKILRTNGNKEVNYTNFVENGCIIIKPDFVPNIIDVCGHQYIKTGWGSDFIFIKKIKDKYKKLYPHVGVINKITVYHPGSNAYSSLNKRIPRRKHKIWGNKLLKAFNTEKFRPSLLKI